MVLKNYDEQYEEYKDYLMSANWFIDSCVKKFDDSIEANKKYINKTEVFAKVSILSAISGASLMTFVFMSGRDTVASIIIRIVSLILLCICSIFAMIVKSKFIQASGEGDFFSFKYDKYIEDIANEESKKEVRDLIYRIRNTLASAEYYAQKDKANREECLYFLKKLGNIEQEYSEAVRYERFAKELQKDYDLFQKVRDSIKKRL